MTKEDVVKLLCEHFSEGMVRTIMDSLKQEQGEPLCAECGIGGGYALYCVACAEKFFGNKEWVGLTNEQIVDLVIKNAGFPTKLVKAIENKLKEKNGY